MDVAKVVGATLSEAVRLCAKNQPEVIVVISCDADEMSY